jgi:hypothetical protein
MNRTGPAVTNPSRNASSSIISQTLDDHGRFSIRRPRLFLRSLLTIQPAQLTPNRPRLPGKLISCAKVRAASKCSIACAASPSHCASTAGKRRNGS